MPAWSVSFVDDSSSKSLCDPEARAYYCNPSCPSEWDATLANSDQRAKTLWVRWWILSSPYRELYNEPSPSWQNSVVMIACLIDAPWDFYNYLLASTGFCRLGFSRHVPAVCHGKKAIHRPRVISWLEWKLLIVLIHSHSALSRS